MKTRDGVLFHQLSCTVEKGMSKKYLSRKLMEKACTQNEKHDKEDLKEKDTIHEKAENKRDE